MSAPESPVHWTTATTDEILRDLHAGRVLPPRPADRVLALRARSRPTLGGTRSRALAVRALVAGRLAPRLARRALGALWFTPWVHASANLPVDDAGIDARTWTHTVGDVRLQGWQAGTGPTAVLVHGWGSRAADMRHLAVPLVAAGWRVVLPDLPGHGRSDGHDTDIHELRDAISSVLATERPRLVVAHSLGALATMLALEVADHVPDGLVAVAPARSADRALSTFADRLGLRSALVRELRRAIEDRLGVGAWEEVDADRAAAGLTTPLLLVQDADDTEVRFADAESVAAAWAGPVTFTATTGLGHRRILRAEATRDAMTAFAAALRSGGAGGTSTRPVHGAAVEGDRLGAAV